MKAVTDKTAKEVALKQMSPALTEAEVTARHGPLRNGVQRYGIEQGIDSDDSKKFRWIDSDNDNNLAAARKQ